jgi:septal ring factor EnvC (AmiA/AmiB activator)
MRANDFLTERQSDSNMELSRLYRVAKARYPMYDKEVALLKYLQSGSIRSDKEDVKITADIKQLEKDVKKLDRQVTDLEKKDFKDLDKRVRSLEKKANES